LVAMETADFAAISAASVATLATSQVVALLTMEIVALRTDQAQVLTSVQAAALHTSQLQALETADFAAMSTASVASLAASQVVALLTTEIVALRTDQARALTSVQAAALYTSQIQALETADFAAINTGSVAALRSDQIVALTTAQARALATQQSFALNTAQLIALETVDLVAISTGSVAALNTASVASLATSQFAALLTTQIAALTTSQILALNTAQMRAMTTAQMRGMETVDIAVLTSTQVAAFSTCAFTGLQSSALSALAAPSYTTPIVLDLNGDGISTLSMADGVRFGFASGQPVQTGWVAPTDGLLVRDLNSDGNINDGTELFGNNTLMADGSTAADGYQALAQLDTNYDGVINSSDAVYSQLGVWVDSNSDGISEAGEIKSLTALGITEISVIASVTSSIDHGNIIGLTSSYQTVDGISHLAGDVWFAVQPTDAIGPAALLSAELPALNSEQVSALSAANVKYAPATLPVNLMQSVAESLVQRASNLAQAIGSFDMSTDPATAPLELSTPVVSNNASSMSATLAIDNLVGQMRGFMDTTLPDPPSTLVTSPEAGLTAMQVAPVGPIDPIKISSVNEFNSLAGIGVKKF